MPQAAAGPWQASPLTIVLVVCGGVGGLGSNVGIALVLPLVAIAACFQLLIKVADLPPLHAAAGALIAGETLGVFAATLLQHGAGALPRHAIDFAVPSLLLASFLSGRFALARNAAPALWLLLIWEAYGLYTGVLFAEAQPTLVIFLKIAIRLAATVALTLIAIGWEAPGGLPWRRG